MKELWETTARNFEGGDYYWILMAEMPSLERFRDAGLISDHAFISWIKREILRIVADVNRPNPPSDWLGYGPIGA